MYSRYYSEFPAAGGFIILEAQHSLFVSLQQNKPEIYSEIVDCVQKKTQEKHRQTFVVIYGDYNDGECPKQLSHTEKLDEFSVFTVDSNVVPEIHSSGWITESLCVVGSKK